MNEQAAERTGATLVGALTGAVADGLDAVAGRRCSDVRSAATIAAPWRHELAGDRCGREGDIARLTQVDDSGDGNGHKAVGATDGSVALGERLDHDILNTQIVEADGNGADVDDGVDGAHLMKQDGVGRFA